jgi:uracil-DNA glycosylase family protein
MTGALTPPLGTRPFKERLPCSQLVAEGAQLLETRCHVTQNRTHACQRTVGPMQGQNGELQRNALAVLALSWHRQNVIFFAIGERFYGLDRHRSNGAMGPRVPSSPSLNLEAGWLASMTSTRIRAADVAQDGEAAPRTLRALNALIQGLKPLVPGATRAVLGEGPVGAAVAFVGEQPGDQEDHQGRPFVGPAGQLLDRALAEAGLERSGVYVTNAVKHFKFEQRGKRRIHQKPTAGEVKHYRWWLDQELRLVHPRFVVALGATAVLALAGKALPIGLFRGPADFGGRRGFITVHPSYLLRIPDRKARHQGYEDFVGDLRSIRKLANKAGAA